MEKLPVAILGSGNIGTDLMYKVSRSPRLDLKVVAGIDPNSEGLARARELGFHASAEGIDAILDMPGIRLVFDATSAKAHHAHAPRLRDAGIVAIDMTPAAVGPGVVPSVNLHDRYSEPNVNMVSCGAQATVPVVAAIGKVARVRYAETVSTVASASAGPGTRQNIDEFTRTTANSVWTIGGAERSKSIIVLNPADPPIIMRNTVYAQVELPVDMEAVRNSVLHMAERVRAYVPGYTITLEPVLEGDIVQTSIEVTGAGDYLPTYAGNLDIINAAAIAVAERYAEAAETTH